MTDFHTHLLPEIDDGSHSVEESIKMLEMMASSGIEQVIATPHFYANQNSLQEFLQKREEAYEKLKPYLKDGFPEIVLGAEVRYYDSISSFEHLDKLCIKGTNLLLLEMPFSKWSKFSSDELLSLCLSGKFTVVIPHIERYLPFQDKRQMDMLYANGMLAQMNANEFLSFFSRKKAIKNLKNQKVHFLGSDCHNLTTRPPNLDRAVTIIKRKLGKEFVDDFISYGNQMFSLK